MRRSDPLAMNRAQAKLALKSVATEPLDTGVLFAGGSEVVITHGAEVYRLRLTRQNKLILTK
jgi:hemin uptake protein HemP